MKHGVPIECLKERDDTLEISRYNSTHHKGEIIHSDICVKYAEIMAKCRSTENNTNPSKMKAGN